MPSAEFEHHVNFRSTFVVTAYFWLLSYAFWLVVHDIVFNTFSKSLILIVIIAVVLHTARLQPPPPEAVDAILGSSSANPVSSTRRESYEHYYRDFVDTIVEGLFRNMVAIASKDPRVGIVGSIAQAFIESRKNATTSTTVNTPTVRSAVDLSPSTTPLIPRVMDMPLFVPVVARRCAGTDAPENSISAIRALKKNGCNYVHFDLALTKDNVAVLFHDDDLIRVAGLNEKISKLASSQLKPIDISQGFKKYQGESIPTFEEALQKCIALKLKLFISVLDYSKPMIDTVCHAYQTVPELHSMAAIVSIHPKVIYYVRRRDPRIVAVLATRSLSHNEGSEPVPGIHVKRLRKIAHPPSFFTASSPNPDREKRSPLQSITDYLAMFYMYMHDWLINNVLWWFLGISVILVSSSRISHNLVRTWEKKGVRLMVSDLSNKVEKLHTCLVLNVGYFTDSVREDPVLHPDRLLVGDARVLSKYLFTSSPEEDVKTIVNPINQNFEISTLTKQHVVDSMYSFPPSPSSSLKSINSSDNLSADNK